MAPVRPGPSTQGPAEGTLEPSNSDARWPGWGPLAVAGGIAVATAAAALGSLPISLFDPELDSIAASNLLQLVVGISLAGTAVGFAAACSGGGSTAPLRRLGMNGIGLRSSALAVGGWLAYVGVAAVLSPVLNPDQQDIAGELGAGADSVLATITAAVLIIGIAPISEELFFRGFIFAGLKQAVPVIAAAFLSATLWGVLHLGGGSVGVAIQITIFGVILALLYERTDTLWAPVVAHMLNNAVAFTLLTSDAV